MKKLLLSLLLFFIPIIIYSESSPMEGLQWEFAQSFCEQDGYAIVEGVRLQYWLYDTYSYHNGDSQVIHNQIIPRWIEKMGYVIDYENIEEYYPNTALASSVRILMAQRGCDVSLILVTKDLEFAPYDYVIINEYVKSMGIYWSKIYPLYRLTLAEDFYANNVAVTTTNPANFDWARERLKEIRGY